MIEQAERIKKLPDQFELMVRIMALFAVERYITTDMLTERVGVKFGLRTAQRYMQDLESAGYVKKANIRKRKQHYEITDKARNIFSSLWVIAQGITT